MATFTNRATLSYSGRTTDSNIVTGVIQETLSVTKNAVIDEYAPGDEIVYVINVVNSGAAQFTDVTLTDNLGSFIEGTQTLTPLSYVDGSAQYYVNGVLQPAPAVTAGESLVIGGITVPAGANVTVIYVAAVNGSAPLDIGDSIANTVTVTGDGIVTPLSATETVSALSRPELAITKSLTPTTVIENGRLTYTFTIQNYGNTPADATDNVTVTDTFDPILRDIAVTYEGENWVSPANYTYDTASGLFVTNAGQITVPAATYTRDADGIVQIIPGSVTLTVTGTI